MADKKPDVKFELNTPELIAAYNVWVAGKAAKDAAEESMDRANAILKPAMREAKANVATVAGQAVLRLVDSSRATFDAAVLRKLAPKAAAKALKVSTFDYLKKS